MTNQELKKQFERCQQWDDPEQWELLAMEYYRRGYYMNAMYCFKQAGK